MTNEKRELIVFTTEADWLLHRTKDLTSTDIPALFGLSPYQTARTLWESKKNPDPTPMEISKRMRAGQKLEAAIAELIAEENNWTVIPFKDYMRIPEFKIGSSFDYKIIGESVSKHDSRILEIKNVSSQFFKTWFNKDGELEAPYHIELQVQHQMLVSGCHKAVIGVLFGGNDWHTIERDENPQIQERILKLSAEFWKSIEENNPPAWDFENDIEREFIKKIYAKPTAGVTIQADKDLEALMEAYLEMNKEVADAVKQKEKLAADIQVVMKDAEEAVGTTYKATWKLVKRKAYEVKESESRQFRVSGGKK